MSVKPLFHSTCPSCGAPVELASSASAFAVCGYCNSSLSREGDALQQLGKMSAVLEDYSPLQLGTSGQWKGRGFTLVGRIQMSYAGGFWNEWYLVHDDGKPGWMSDASGQYAMLDQVATDTERLPAYETLKPGMSAQVHTLWLTVSDRREARCIAAQGELPFAVSERWTARVVDLRDQDSFFTLDFSEAQPVLYRGISVRLEQLKAQFVRGEDSINESAGRLKGKLQALSCPNCGSSVKAVAGTTRVANCGTCGSTLDVQSKTAQLLLKGREAHSRASGSYLDAGDAGVLRGVSWTVLGVIQQKSSSEGEVYRWTDYLLFNAKQGLRWLSRSSDNEWLFCEPMDRWPLLHNSKTVSHENVRFELADRYASEVERVWGSFNWLVQAGDKTQCLEFKASRSNDEVSKGAVLVRETTESECAWTMCSPVAADQVAVAFGKRKEASAARSSRLASSASGFSETTTEMIKYAGIGHMILWFVYPTFLGAGIGIAALFAILALGMKGEAE